MLKIVTYNIECGLQKLKLMENIKTFVKKEGVNIFCFQEAKKIKNEPFIIEEFLKVLGSKWKAEYFLKQETNSVASALCIMWNTKFLNLKESERVSLPFVRRLNLWERVYINLIFGYIETRSWLGFLNHDLKPFDLGRGALVCNFTFNSKNLRVLTTHLDWAGGKKHRLKQVNFISSYLQNSRFDFEIVCGDFNTLGSFFGQKKNSDAIKQFLPSGFFDTLTDPRPTANFFQRLDYIYAKGFKEGNAEVFQLEGSDHKPVMANLF